MKELSGGIFLIIGTLKRENRITEKDEYCGDFVKGHLQKKNGKMWEFEEKQARKLERCATLR